MQFQTLDSKSECVGIYVDGDLSFEELPEGLTKTWSHSEFLPEGIEYAQLYCLGASLAEVCPPHLHDQWERVNARLRANYRALSTSKISLDEHCFYDLVPESMLHEFCEIKDLITTWVFDNYERPANYEFMASLASAVSEMASSPLNLNFKSLNSVRHKSQVRDFIKKYSSNQQYCKYNIWGTKTGRLSTLPNSFPILTMPKDHRSVIQPNNDWFLELDYNAAELRTVLALSGKSQPNSDIHEWNAANIFKGEVTRDQAKQKVFAWLYGSNLSIIDGDITKILSEVYRKEEIVRQHWSGAHVVTRFGRSIPSDNHHALSYIIQSSCVDAVLRRLVALRTLLSEHSSRIAFTLHDSVVIDLSDRDRHLVPEMIEIFSNTEMGKFKVNVSAGKDFGNLQPLKL